MNIQPISTYKIDNISCNFKTFLSDYHGKQVFIVYFENILRIYSLISGTLLKELTAPDTIESLTLCSFSGYGYCITALLHNDYYIWCENGDEYTVALPCRMSAVYTLDEGVLLERVDDLSSMNTSFTISSSTVSIPMYFSLTSPLSIPKPILQLQEGDNLYDLSNTSISNLSHILNMSMNCSTIDLFNSRLDVNSEDRDIVIISSITEYNLIITYNHIIKEHQFIQIRHVQDSPISFPDDAMIMKTVLSMEETSLNDSVFTSLTNPDYFFFPLFSGIPKEEPFSSVICTSSLLHSSDNYLYCSTQSSVFCYLITNLNQTSSSSITVTFISEHTGLLIGKTTTSCLYLQNSVLIKEKEKWKVILDGIELFSIQDDTRQSLLNTSSYYYSKPSILSLYSSLTKEISTYQFQFNLTEVETQFMCLYSLFSSSLIPVFPIETTISWLTACAQQSPQSTFLSLCLLLDEYWLCCDTMILNTLLQYIDQVKNDLSLESQLLIPFLSSFYSSSSSYPNLFSSFYFFLQSYISIKFTWLPLPYLIELSSSSSLSPYSSCIQSYTKASSILSSIAHFIPFLTSSTFRLPSVPISSPCYSIIEFIRLQLEQNVENTTLTTPATSFTSISTSLLQEIDSLLMNKIVNLHLTMSSSSLSVNPLIAIQTYVETQLLSLMSYSLVHFSPSVTKSSLHHLHDLSLQLILKGRINDESVNNFFLLYLDNLIDCSFQSSTLTPFVIIHSIQVILSSLSQTSLSIHDLLYILDKRTDDETIGVLMALGFNGILQTIGLNLLKLRLQLYSSFQWQKEHNKLYYHKIINYSNEIAFRDTENHDIFTVLRFYIDTILSLSSYATSSSTASIQQQIKTNTLLYDWTTNDRQIILNCLFVCLVGMGIVHHASTNLTILNYLQSLLSYTIDSSSINQQRYHYYLSFAISLVTLSSSSSSAIQFASNYITHVEKRLKEPHEPYIGSFFCTGIDCPVEEMPGDILSIGFMSLYLNYHHIDYHHSIFNNLNPNSIALYIQSQRCDVAFYYGCSLALSYYSDLTSSLSFLLSLVPPSIQHYILTYSFPVKAEQPLPDDDYHNWQAFIGGILYVTSFKYMNSLEHDDITSISSSLLSSSSPIATFILSFLYHLITINQLSYLSSYYRPFILSLIQSLGLFLHSSLHQHAFIILRHLLKQFTELKNKHELTNIDDIITTLSLAIGLIAFDKGQTQLQSTLSSLPYLFTTFLPIHTTTIEHDDYILSIFRELYRCCDIKQVHHHQQQQLTLKQPSDYIKELKSADDDSIMIKAINRLFCLSNTEFYLVKNMVLEWKAMKTMKTMKNHVAIQHCNLICNKLYSKCEKVEIKEELEILLSMLN